MGKEDKEIKRVKKGIQFVSPNVGWPIQRIQPGHWVDASCRHPDSWCLWSIGGDAELGCPGPVQKDSKQMENISKRRKGQVKKICNQSGKRTEEPRGKDWTIAYLPCGSGEMAKWWESVCGATQLDDLSKSSWVWQCFRECSDSLWCPWCMVGVLSQGSSWWFCSDENN